MRPTSILDWVPIFIGDLLRSKRHGYINGFLINATHGLTALAFAVGSESLYFV